ncbi:MAG: hypothetical protein ABL894_01260, partial [Hyphomicrobium sp.]
EQLEMMQAGEFSNADMFGYMLRSAFQDRRRHLEWECHLIDSKLPQILAPVDRDLLSHWLTRHGWPRAFMSSH